MLTISIEESSISIPISSRVEICYTKNGQVVLVDGQMIMKRIKSKIKIQVAS